VRAIVTKSTKDKPRSFFDGIDKWAKEEGASGLAYFTFEKNNTISAKGPVGKLFSEESLKEIMKITSAEVGDSIFLACGKVNDLEKITSLARDKIGKELGLINENEFAFSWIVDYPMFEKDQITKKIKFSHNPFSMPQGDINKIDFNKPLNIKAYQYDIVCNGVELSSGAIRNHIPELMYKLFSIAGYDKKDVHVTYENNLLRVGSNVGDPDDSSDQEKPKKGTIHKGIAKRYFSKAFTIADDVEIKGAELKNGLLKVSLNKILPEGKKPRKIEVK